MAKLGSVINYLTRATLAVAAPSVLKDLAGTAMPADFDWFEYREREYVSDLRRLEIS